MASNRGISWIVVVIHHPIFSAGKGHGNHNGLKDMLLPMFKKYKVDVVLSGHDHNVQYLRSDLDVQRPEIAPQDQFGASCAEKINYGFCTVKEFFHHELGKCGIEKKEAQIRNFQSVLQNGYGFFNPLQAAVSRESVSVQHEYMHHFVLGNGGIKSAHYCPISQTKSEGKLRYGNAVAGVGEFKIREDRIEINLVSAENEILYSTQIFKDVEKEKQTKKEFKEMINKQKLPQEQEQEPKLEQKQEQRQKPQQRPEQRREQKQEQRQEQNLEQKQKNEQRQKPEEQKQEQMREQMRKQMREQKQKNEQRQKSEEQKQKLEQIQQQRPEQKQEQKHEQKPEQRQEQKQEKKQKIEQNQEQNQEQERKAEHYQEKKLEQRREQKQEQTHKLEQKLEQKHEQRREQKQELKPRHKEQHQKRIQV